MAVVFASSLPSVKKVDIALRESRDFDQPVRLTSADERAELVDIALRDAGIDADTASRASEGVAIDDMGDSNSTRAKSHWKSGDEWREKIEQDVEKHGDRLMEALL